MSQRILKLGLWLAVGACALTAGALDPQEQLQFADGLYARGMWDVALKEYQACLDTNRAGVDAVFYRMGECYRSLGRTNDAEQAYEKAGHGATGSDYRFRAGLRRAELMELAGRSADQIKLLTSLLSQTPPTELAAACRYALGAAQEKSGHGSEAMEAYEAVLNQYPDTPFASCAALALGGLVRQQDDGAGWAVELFLQAATHPASPRLGAESWFQLGDVYFQQKQYEKSARAYEKLVSLYPKDERTQPASLPMAWAFYHAGLYAETLKCGEGAGRVKPDEWLYLKANSERQLMKNEEAVATYGLLLSKYPQTEVADSAAYERALTLYKMGHFQEAIRQAKALTLTPRIKKDVYWLLAESSAAVKDDASAVQYYRLLLEQSAVSDLAADALYRLAHLLEKKGEPIQAAELFGQLVDEYPQHALAPQALFVAAACQAKAKKPEQAVAVWARLISDYPQSKFVEESYYQKAMGEAQLRRDAQALATLAELMRRFPKTKFLAEARFWNGTLMEEAGKLEEAEIEFRRALKAGPAEDLERRAQFRLALVLQRRGRLDEAAELLQGLIDSPLREQFTPEILEWLADYQSGRPDFPKAVLAAEALIARASTDAWKQIGWFLKGKALLGQGQSEPARLAFEETVALGIKSQAAAESFLRLGEINLAAGDAAKAKGYFDQAATLSTTDDLLPIRARAYAGIARALRAQGDLPGAAKHFLSVAVLFDDATLTPECLYEAAETFRQSGRTAESVKVARELAERYPDSEWARKAAEAGSQTK
ncbi:MAG: tetratricopeptide repeat protein [bacterium]